jgi:uncharacterized membrane protein
MTPAMPLEDVEELVPFVVLLVLLVVLFVVLLVVCAHADTAHANMAAADKPIIQPRNARQRIVSSPIPGK